MTYSRPHLVKLVASDSVVVSNLRYIFECPFICCRENKERMRVLSQLLKQKLPQLCQFPSLISKEQRTKLAQNLNMPSASLTTTVFNTFRHIPRHQGFDYVNQVLSDMVQNNYPNALLLEESPARMWSLIACKYIYKFTGDVISGSLASAILISFLVHPDLLPYVFLVWATFALICLAVSNLNSNVKGAAQHAEL